MSTPTLKCPGIEAFELGNRTQKVRGGDNRGYHYSLLS
jgi:hypothetical protein